MIDITLALAQKEDKLFFVLTIGTEEYELAITDEELDKMSETISKVYLERCLNNE